MQLKCLIVDDEPPAQRVLEKYISSIPFLELGGKCKNVFEAATVLQSQSIDLMFLDINMPKMSGFEFLRTLKNPPLVIVTTAYREYALEGFELDVLDYLNKPFSFDRFFGAVNKASSRLAESGASLLPHSVDSSGAGENDFVFIKEDKVTYKVMLRDIYYLESVGDYVKVHTPQKVFLAYQTLKKMEEVLPDEIFCRVHKSFVISILHVQSLQGNFLKVYHQVIPVGATYKKQLNDFIKSHDIL